MKVLVILGLIAAILFCTDTVSTRKWSNRNKQRECLSGDGTSYRGVVSKSASGRRCLFWNNFGRDEASLGLFFNNYCRNPDESPMPWCHVRKGEGTERTEREFCDIPKCGTETATSSVDTELTCGERTERGQSKIVGGSVAPIESQPWMAAFFKGDKFKACAGSLISPCWVLTAAHCFEDGFTRRLSVHLGKNAVNATDAGREQMFTIEQVIPHPQYDLSYNNDIALVKIKRKDGECASRTPSARTVCLPPPLTMLPPGTVCNIAGFGWENNSGGFSQFLKQSQVTLMSLANCKAYYEPERTVTQNMFCAASPDWSTDACKGDSGGPLVCDAGGRMFLFGVISWGEGCAKKKKPGVYTRVTNYNHWIAETTGLSAFTAGVMYPKK